MNKENNIEYITGYRFAIEDLKEKINIWFEEDDIEPLYLIAKLSGYMEAVLDTLKVKIK